MTVLGFCSAKGSPGVSTAVLAVASAWPVGHSLLVVDLDPSGGDLAGWLELAPTPGIATLAVEARRGLTAADVWSHAQPVPGAGNVHLLAGALSPEEAFVAADLLLRAGIGGVLRSLDAVDVVVDLGRLDLHSPVAAMTDELDQLFVVVRPTWSQVHHVSVRLPEWRKRARTGLLQVGERPYPATEVAEAVGAPVAAVLADDARAAEALAGNRAVGRGIERSRLWRSARPVADSFATPHPAGSTAPVESNAETAPC